MVTKTIDELVDELKVVLDFYEVDYPKKNDDILEIELKSAIGVINRCRRFEPTDEILYDIKYEDKIMPLCVASFMKMGAEGETLHTENGIMRHYGDGNKYPKTMLADIIPLVK